MFRKILLSIAALFLANILSATTLVLSNGDKITGAVQESDTNTVVVKTAFGVLSVPREMIAERIEPQTAKSVESKAISLMGSGGTASASQSLAAEESKVDEHMSAVEKSWREQYVEAVNPYLAGWKVKFRAGMDYKKTNSSYTAYTLGLNADRKWDKDSVALAAYYDYTRESPVTGPEYTSTDKYGASAVYRRDLNTDEGWFFTNTLSYRKDMVKGIDHEINEIVGVGYTFKMLDDSLIINVYGGPGLKYIQANNYSDHYVAMMTAGEDLVWKFHEWMRIENKMGGEINLTNGGEYTFNFMLGLVVSPTPVFDLAARYTFQYDGINAGSSVKTEQRFIIALEVPFGWD